MPLATRPPTRPSTRSAISRDALFVNVIDRMAPGFTRSSRIRYATRCVNARVFPEPAPATMRTGPSVWRTASAWMSFRPSSRGERTLTSRL